MVYSSSPFIDGQTTLKYRSVYGDGTEGSPFYSGVIFPNTQIENNRVKTVHQRHSEVNLQTTANSSLAQIALFDVRDYSMFSMRIDNNGAALSDFIVDVSFNSNSGTPLWEEIANGDYFFTTGTGENEGNAMKLIRKVSPVNPRTLPSTGSTWLIFNVDPMAYIRIRARTGSGSTTLDFRAYARLI